jgi:hypothetical protein
MSAPENMRHDGHPSWPWWVAGALCIIAVTAIGITVPATLHARRHSPADNSRALALAPGLAALSDQQLADLLPKPDEFPRSWTMSNRPVHDDRFSYFRRSSIRQHEYYDPAECEDVQTDPTGTVNAVEVSGRDPANQATYPGASDITVGISREFNPAGFQAMITRAARCTHFTFDAVLSLNLTVLQDSRPDNGVRIFRFAVTSTDPSHPEQTPTTEYHSYATQSALIVSATASSGHQKELDTLFDSTVRRIERH